MKAESEKTLVELLDNETNETRRAQLLGQISDDPEAQQAYQLIINAEAFIDELPIENPSPKFNDGILLGYKRLKTRENNNRLMTYFVGVAAAIVALIFTFAGDTSTSLPAPSTPILEQIGDKIPDWSITLNPDSLLQLVLVLNAGLLIVLIEKIVSKRKVLSLHSFV